MNNSKGFTLIEVLVSSGILCILLYVFMTFYSDSSKIWGKIMGSSNRVRALNYIQRDLLEADRFIPPLYSSTLTNEELVTPEEGEEKGGFESLKNTDFIKTRCYSSRGVRMEDEEKTATGPDDLNCFFYVQFYKIQVKDRNFKETSPLSNLPISRINVKIQYKENGEDKAMYLSRLATQIIYF